MSKFDAIVQVLRDLNAEISQQKESLSRQQALFENLIRYLSNDEATVFLGSNSTAGFPLSNSAASADVSDWTQLKPGGSPIGPVDGPLINWVIGPADNAGWAYGNNARRLASRLPGFRHAMSSEDPSWLAVYFDVIVADRFPVKSHFSILRLGGPRPLNRMFGENEEALSEGLSKFDVVVALSLELFRRAAKVHSNVHFIPNALDIDEWRPERRKRSKDAPFTVGFASSLKSSQEIEVKGFDIARMSAEKAGVRFIHVQKEEGHQVAHGRMIEDFFSKCDVIAHPVMPGREGTSNVVMEALAVGMPVITTSDCGFHGETLIDRKTAMIRPRDVEAFSEAMQTLSLDKKLRQRISNAALDFARRNHDLATAAAKYRRIAFNLMSRTKDTSYRPTVCFVPFWLPAMSYASSRIRALYPSAYLRENGYGSVNVGYDPLADVAVVIQSCDNDIFEQIKNNHQQFLIYDVCDRYYENVKIFKKPGGDVNSLMRYEELVERADLIIVPTLELKVEISSRNPNKPVVYVSEPIDYAPKARMFAPIERKKVLWFGNPDRGNFESARWMIEHLRDAHGYEPLLVSRRSFFKSMPELLPHVIDWSPEMMENAYKEAGVCVLAHASDEGSKSPNRMISAIMHGVPTLVSNSPSCAEILLDAGMEFAIVDSPRKLDKAMQKILTPTKRKPFVEKLQRRFREAYGPEAISTLYENVFTHMTFGKKDGGRKLRVAFVSHNLSLGEGAPWSLCELATGMNMRDDVDAFAYSPGGGPLEAQYREAGIPLEVFDTEFSHCVKVLNRRYSDAQRHFLDYLRIKKIDVVVCNTVRAAPYVHFAGALGIPSVLIIRESFGAAERFESYTHEARVAAEVGVFEAAKVVFVSGKSREAWSDQNFPGDTRIIPNGISPRRFEASILKSKAETRLMLGLPQDDVIAVCVGTVNLRKGQEGIVKAFSNLPASVRDHARIVFLGATDNEYITSFQEVVAGLHESISSRISIVKATLDTGPWYRASDIFLMNSTSEAYPRSVVEALYFGLPVLSTKVFGVLEQIQHGHNGFLYDFEDMIAWSQHFQCLVDDKSLRDQMSQTASRSFWKLTTYAEMLHSYRSLIGDVYRRAQSQKSVNDGLVHRPRPQQAFAG